MNDGFIVIDVRSSDAVALALRFRLSILADDNIPTFKFDDSSDEAKDLKNRLREIKPDDLGLEE